MKSLTTLEKSLIGINGVLLCLIISAIIYIYVRFIKENYEWNMPDSSFINKINIGEELSMNNKYLLLGGKNLPGDYRNSGIKYFDNFGSIAVDGSVMYGKSGGGLATNNNNMALQWDDNRIVYSHGGIRYNNVPSGTTLSIKPSEVFDYQFGKNYFTDNAIQLLQFNLNAKGMSTITINMITTGVYNPGSGFMINPCEYQIILWNNYHANSSNKKILWKITPKSYGGVFGGVYGQSSYSTNGGISNIDSSNLDMQVNNDTEVILKWVGAIYMVVHYHIIAGGDCSWTLKIL